MSPPPLIVFTDLDGTLLDHHDYSWQAARPALEKLRDIGAPVVIASSKTAAEIAPLRAEIGFAHCPAIVENGAGRLAANAAPDDNAEAYKRLRTALDTLPADLRARFRGFGDLSDAEVAEITGLPLPNARLARQRAFSEPGLLEGDDTPFVDALKDAGLHTRRGGRFLTLSFGGTKADQMAEISADYGTPMAVALGDAPNDVEMLESADLGVIITNPSGQDLPRLAGESSGRIIRSAFHGPKGWNAAILKLLSDNGLT